MKTDFTYSLLAIFYLYLKYYFLKRSKSKDFTGWMTTNMESS